MKTADDIARFLRESPGPLNIFAGPGTPPVPELRRLGVARVSLAAGPYRAAIGVLKKIAGELRAAGTYGTLTENCISAEEASKWFA
jgi:2-methylisocitrate lyase-like PEP mutase family enzyme